MNVASYPLWLALLLLMMPLPSRAELSLQSIGIREASSAKSNDQIDMQALVVRLKEDRLSDRLPFIDAIEVGAGWTDRHGQKGHFLSAGPVFQFDIGRSKQRHWHMDLGFQVTYFGNALFNRKSPGGNIQFMSHFGIVRTLNTRTPLSIMLDYRHISNAEIQDTNFGADLVSISLNYFPGVNHDKVAAD